jgi:hypothetical protein
MVWPLGQWPWRINSFRVVSRRCHRKGWWLEIPCVDHGGKKLLSISDKIFFLG